MSNTKTHPRATCDCGRPATVRLHSEWICARCASLEHRANDFHEPAPGRGHERDGFIRAERRRVWGWRVHLETAFAGVTRSKFRVEC